MFSLTLVFHSVRLIGVLVGNQLLATAIIGHLDATQFLLTAGGQLAEVVDTVETGVSFMDSSLVVDRDFLGFDNEQEHDLLIDEDGSDANFADGRIIAAAELEGLSQLRFLARRQYGQGISVWFGAWSSR